MAFIVPDLPYAYDALEPWIDEATMRVHHDKHHAAYAANLDRFRTPERVRVRHILLKTQDKPAAEAPNIEKRAQDLLKQARSGADFAQLASKNSEDPGSAAKGGDLDWITRGQTVPEFEQAAFSLKPGQISDLVKTVYGFHILKIEAKEDARLRPLAEVKEQLRKELSQNEVFNKMQLAADQIRAALIKSPSDAEQAAAPYGLAPITASNVRRSQPIPEVGMDDNFIQSVFSLPKNGVTPVLTVGGNKLVFAQVASIQPERPAQLAEVENEVREQVLLTKIQKMTREAVEAASARLKSGAPLEAVARELGATVKTSPLVDRNASIEGFGLASAAADAFKKNPGEIAGPINSGGGAFFMKVEEKQPADLTQLPAQRDQILNELKNRRARDRRAIFLDSVVQSLVKEKKVKIYEENINRLIGSFRS